MGMQVCGLLRLIRVVAGSHKCVCGTHIEYQFDMNEIHMHVGGMKKRHFGIFFLL